MKDKLKIEGVSLRYDKLLVLDNINFSVKEGEFVSIVGPSGCGKTSLLHLIEGFINPTKGSIECFGKKGYVFQEYNLFDWKTVYGNVEMSQKYSKDSKEVDIHQINSLLKSMGLWKFKDYYPHQLSGGMKQRVGIGRCLSFNANILLMDEPFGSLDYLTKIQIQKFLMQLRKEKNLTIVYVTHDIDEAIKLSDRIIILSEFPAKILRIVNVNQSKKESIKEDILNILLNGNNALS